MGRAGHFFSSEATATVWLISVFRWVAACVVLFVQPAVDRGYTSKRGLFNLKSCVHRHLTASLHKKLHCWYTEISPVQWILISLFKDFARVIWVYSSFFLSLRPFLYFIISDNVYFSISSIIIRFYFVTIHSLII